MDYGLFQFKTGMKLYMYHDGKTLRWQWRDLTIRSLEFVKGQETMNMIDFLFFPFGPDHPSNMEAISYITRCLYTMTYDSVNRDVEYIPNIRIGRYTVNIDKANFKEYIVDLLRETYGDFNFGIMGIRNKGYRMTEATLMEYDPIANKYANPIFIQMHFISDSESSDEEMIGISYTILLKYLSSYYERMRAANKIQNWWRENSFNPMTQIGRSIIKRRLGASFAI